MPDDNKEIPVARRVADDLPLAKAVRKEPTVSRAPPPGKMFPCNSCGARLNFDPAQGGLACPYCGFKEEIAESENGEVVERDYFQYLNKLRDASKIQGIVGHTNESKCSGCGAMVILDDKIAADQCPFCHTPLEGKANPVEGLIEPESLLPFEYDLRAAREAYSKWLEGLWFAPSELKKIANLGQLTGVYVPYWTYDSMTYTRYVGERGDNYTTYETYTTRDANGNLRTETRPVVRIAWTSVSGEVQHFFDDVLVCASNSLPEQLIAGLKPWDLGNLKPFQADYLSGFQAEHYQVNLQDGLNDAKQQMAPVITELVRQDIGGDHQRIGDQRTKFNAVTFKHTLLPVWLAVYRYREQVFQILVNGRTGKVVGRRPWSVWKIARLVMAILLVIGLIVAIASLASKHSNNAPAPRVKPVKFRVSQSTFEESIPPRGAAGRAAAWPTNSAAAARVSHGGLLSVSTGVRGSSLSCRA